MTWLCASMPAPVRKHLYVNQETDKVAASRASAEKPQSMIIEGAARGDGITPDAFTRGAVITGGAAVRTKKEVHLALERTVHTVYAGARTPISPKGNRQLNL